jgi:hypothetical protein
MSCLQRESKRDPHGERRKREKVWEAAGSSAKLFWRTYSRKRRKMSREKKWQWALIYDGTNA